MPAWLLIAWQVVQMVGYLVKYGPTIVTMVQEILAALRKLRAPDDEKKALALEFKGAVSHYRHTGDKGPLRRLRDRLNTRVHGDAW